MIEITVGEFTDKVNAAANKVAGKVKEEIGKAMENEQLEAEASQPAGCVRHAFQ